MTTKHMLAMFILLLCTACTVSVAPIATPSGVVDSAAKSITEIHDGVAFTVKHDELSVAPYAMVDNITSFYVTIDNRTASAVSFPPQAFLLKDGDGRQYRSVTPERVREMVSKDAVYLIPYPYVGYYYLEDQKRLAYANTFSSSLPFYAEYHPQDIFTRALTQEPVLGNSKVSGDVYFIADLEKTGYAELQLFADAATSGPPLLIFPFAVEK